MNEIINKFLLAGDKLSLKCISDSLDLRIVFMDKLLKTKEEYNNSKKQELQDTFIKTN